MWTLLLIIAALWSILVPSSPLNVRETNAARFSRGLGPLKPRRLFKQNAKPGTSFVFPSLLVEDPKYNYVGHRARDTCNTNSVCCLTTGTLDDSGVLDAIDGSGIDTSGLDSTEIIGAAVNLRFPEIWWVPSLAEGMTCSGTSES